MEGRAVVMRKPLSTCSTSLTGSHSSLRRVDQDPEVQLDHRTSNHEPVRTQ
jgi:hypothetical protein